MDSFLKFQDETLAVDPEYNSSPSKSSYGHKLVPWLNWDEWEYVRDSLFSDSPPKIASALQRVMTWRSRGCIPVVIDVTASIIEIQQKDPFYRKDLHVDSTNSEQMLAMLYCMAILRLVNCIVEKTRKKTEISIAEAASAIGIPRTLIDIRHEGSHRDLPALALVRDSAVKAVDWLKYYYWEPQRKQISFKRDETASIRKNIKSKLRELAYCLIVKQNPQHGALLFREKRSKNHESLGGHKFFSIMTAKLNSSKSGGQKKQIDKSLKILVRLYSSFSSDVLSVLIDFLLKVLESSNLVDVEEDNQVDQKQTFLDDWKLVMKKLSDKEPEMPLMLLKSVLNLIETENGSYLTSPDYGTLTAQIEKLSFLFAWIVSQLKGLKKHHKTDGGTEVSCTGVNVSDAIMEILRKCIMVSSHGNKQLMDSALCLAQLVDDVSLTQRLNRLFVLCESNSVENSVQLSSNNLLNQQDDVIREAGRKLELIMLQRAKSKSGKTADGGYVESPGRWSVAGSWNTCPIGMLPRELGSSGRLPVLASHKNEKRFEASFKSKKNWELDGSIGITDATCDFNMLEKQSVQKTNRKREASYDISSIDRSNVKKMRDAVERLEPYRESMLSSVEGCLMIDGVWKNIGDEELLAIKSAVRILIQRPGFP